MNRIWMIVLLPLILIVGLSLFISRTGDGEIFVPPPESVAESFIRQLATGRYSRALPYLTDDLRRQLTSEDLQKFTESLEAELGRVDDVRGEAGGITGERAQAQAVVRTERGESVLALVMRREQQTWQISELPEIR